MVTLFISLSSQIAGRCDATGERNPRTDQVTSKLEKSKKLVSARAAYLKQVLRGKSNDQYLLEFAAVLHWPQRPFYMTLLA